MCISLIILPHIYIRKIYKNCAPLYIIFWIIAVLFCKMNILYWFKIQVYLIFSSICLIFFLSILWIIKYFVKYFYGTLQASIVIFGIQVDDDGYIVGLRTSLLLLILSCFSPDFFINDFFVQGFCGILQKLA